MELLPKLCRRTALPLAICAGAFPLRAQIFPNGGFESGTANWTISPAGAATIVTGTLTQSGTGAAQVITTGSSVVIERDLNLLPGLNTTISGCIRAVSTTGTARKARADLVIVKSGTEQIINLGQQITNSSTYKQYTVNQWIPLDVESTKLRLSTSGTTTALYDSFTVQYTTGKQLIQDRGFEEFAAAMYFSGTNTIKWTSTAGCSVSGTAHGGANAAVVVPGTGNRQVMQDFPLAPGQTITIRGYVKTEDMGIFKGGILLKCLNSGGTPAESDITVGELTGSTGYTKLEKTISISGTSTTVRGQLRLFGWGGTGCTGKVYFDDISVTEATGDVRAFPGAEGFGSNTPGGRGPDGTSPEDVVIYRVTNLAGSASGTIAPTGSGSGTLRYVLEQGDDRKYFVLFGREGIIDLAQYNANTGLPVSTDPILLTKPFKTIAGQTAPGAGITLRSGGLRIKTSDVVIRGMRFRPGGLHCFTGTHYKDVPEAQRDAFRLPYINESARDCLAFDQSVNKVANCVVDHCSFAWSTDEQIQFYVYGGTNDEFSAVPIENMTFSHNLITEPLDSPWHIEFDPNDFHHAYQISVDWVKNLSMHHNLFIHGQRRQPEIRPGCEIELVNNIVYNYEQVATEFYGSGTAATILKPTKALLIHNLYLDGPNSIDKPDTIVLSDTKAVPPGISFNAKFPPDEGSRIYMEGNIGHYRKLSTDDQWAESEYSGTLPWPNGTRVSSPGEAMAGSGVTRTDVTQLKDRLLLTGSYASRYNRPGAYPHDEVDRRSLADIPVNNGDVPLAVNFVMPNGSNLIPDRLYTGTSNQGPLALSGTARTKTFSYRMQDEYGNGNGRQYDDWDLDTFHHYGGYMATTPINPSAADKMRGYEHNYNGGGRGILLRDMYTPLGAISGAGSYGFVAGRTYTGTLTIQRTAADAVTLSLVFNGSMAHGSTGAWTYSGSDSIAATWAFDTIAFQAMAGGGFTSLTLDNIVVSKGATQYLAESFADGNRTGQSLPSSAAWFGSSAASLPPGGNVMSLQPGGAGLAYFAAEGSPVELAVGEAIQASFTFVCNGSGFATDGDFLRVGLLNSHGTPTNHNGVPIAPETAKIASRVAADGFDPLPDANGNGVPDNWEDNNGNGLPDAWEANYLGGPIQSTQLDPKAVSADGEGGYLNVEIYINSFIPPNDK